MEFCASDDCASAAIRTTSRVFVLAIFLLLTRIFVGPSLPVATDHVDLAVVAIAAGVAHTAHEVANIRSRIVIIPRRGVLDIRAAIIVAIPRVAHLVTNVHCTRRSSIGILEKKENPCSSGLRSRSEERRVGKECRS